MTPFDPQAAYAGDWTHFDDVVDATLDPRDGSADKTVKVRPTGRLASDYQDFAGVQLSGTARVVHVWAGDATGVVISPEDKLTFTDALGVEATWRIGAIGHQSRSYWRVAATKIAVNA